MSAAKRLSAILTQHVDRRLLAPLGSIALSAKRGERCVVRYDNGDWIHRYAEGIVVQPALGGPSARWQDRDTWDYFLHGYRPGRGDTVLDLGAGVGGEVRVLSRLVGPPGRVISLEPHPRIFRCLRQTVELNGLTNVTALQFAVTAVPGPVYMTDDPECHVVNALAREERYGITVTGKTLAEIVALQNVDRIDLLKMNIEGAELEVLRSAADVLPIVHNLVVSCHDFIAGAEDDKWKRTFAPVCALLTAAGYDVRTRPNDPRPWVPYYVYASRPSAGE